VLFWHKIWQLYLFPIVNLLVKSQNIRKKTMSFQVGFYISANLSSDTEIDINICPPPKKISKIAKNRKI